VSYVIGLFYHRAVIFQVFFVVIIISMLFSCSLKETKQVNFYDYRIDDKNRLVYKVSDNQITIVACANHYK